MLWLFIACTNTPTQANPTASQEVVEAHPTQVKAFPAITWVAPDGEPGKLAMGNYTIVEAIRSADW